MDKCEGLHAWAEDLRKEVRSLKAEIKAKDEIIRRGIIYLTTLG